MTGYIDGTENPKGEEAEQAGIVQGKGPGLDGSSFVAVQQWIHNLDAFDEMTQEEQDNTFGRRKSDNEELNDAPASAHVKRTAQESFSPEAFVLRRSMPWANEQNAGLMFVAFGYSFYAYEALLENMLGLKDGIVDGLFGFTQPVTGAYFWCPPVKGKHLDLSALDL
jgi:putative iron-dependent peroxidase